MEDADAQLELWQHIGSTRAVTGAAEGSAEGPARPADAKETPGRETGAAKGKARIVHARHGNAFVVRREE